jgi:hypothetical protein
LSIVESLLRLHETLDNEEVAVSLAAKTNNDVRFGKFLIGLIKKLRPSISGNLSGILSERIAQHSSFLKKTIESELKKKSVKS